MVRKRLGRRRFDSSIEWGGCKFLDVGIEQIRGQLPNQPLGILAVLNQRSGFAKGQEDLEFSNCLIRQSAPRDSGCNHGVLAHHGHAPERGGLAVFRTVCTTPRPRMMVMMTWAGPAEAIQIRLLERCRRFGSREGGDALQRLGANVWSHAGFGACTRFRRYGSVCPCRQKMARNKTRGNSSRIYSHRQTSGPQKHQCFAEE